MTRYQVMSEEAERNAILGAENLLNQCLVAKPGEVIVLLAEDPALGHYDAAAPRIVAETAQAHGCQVRVLPVGFGAEPQSYLDEWRSDLDSADHILFFARIGDQIRFDSEAKTQSRVMIYTLDQAYLASPFGTLPHGLMTAIKDRLETALLQSEHWRISCPLGSDLRGSSAGFRSSDLAFSLKLFPVPTFQPVPCADATGQVAIAHWLMNTDTHSYDDDVLFLDEPVMAHIEAGRIVDLEGPSGIVTQLRDHYRRVADLFAVDGSLVGSWHAGIHPGAYYAARARDDIKRWGGIAFANPRYLHFHTCGGAPGEIAWSLFDATVELDGEATYERGRFVFSERPEIQVLCRDHGVDPETLQYVGDIGID